MAVFLWYLEKVTCSVYATVHVYTEKKTFFYLIWFFISAILTVKLRTLSGNFTIVLNAMIFDSFLYRKGVIKNLWKAHHWKNWQWFDIKLIRFNELRGGKVPHKKFFYLLTESVLVDICEFILLVWLCGGFHCFYPVRGVINFQARKETNYKRLQNWRRKKSVF